MIQRINTQQAFDFQNDDGTTIGSQDRYRFESYFILYIDIMGHMPEKNGYSEKIPN